MSKLLPDYEKILKQEEDVKVDAVNQHLIMHALHLDQGICGGLTTQQIIQALNPEMSQGSRNPFRYDDDIEKSVQIAERSEHKLGGFINELLNTSFIRTLPPKKLQQDEISSVLRENQQKTLNDGKSRGVLIGTDFHSDPQAGGHALSFTVEKKADEIYCSALDPNLFFAKGAQARGCQKVIEKLSAAINMYKGSSLLVEAQTEKNEMNLSKELLSTRGLAKGMK